MKTELLKLFNAVLVENKRKKKISDDILERTIKNGYILQPAIRPDTELLDLIETVVGISGEKANAAFHKSWKIVKESSELQLVMQQILHYITTYGFEAMGIYSEDSVYIPREVLEFPEAERIPLVVVKAMTSEEVLEAIVKLGCGIALSEESLNDIMTIVEQSKFDSAFVEKIKNRELKARLYDFYGICPSDPVEYLRYVISKLTDTSLLIKNNELINKIKISNGKFLDELLKNAPEDLASIFFRFKPIFLALKSISRNKTFFNRLRKQANKMHKPMPEDYLNSVTSHIKNKDLDMKTLNKKLSNASIFRKVRLAYALNFRLNSPEAIVYRVRNGRGWSADFAWTETSATNEALDAVVSSIAENIKKNVEGKTIYIPKMVHYAMPATEKQFTGSLPTGTYVSVPEDLIVGVHWTNTDRRIDLDLSISDAGGKIGWDGSYRSSDCEILFSGDVTDAPKPKGASELFYVKKGKVTSKILALNYYNHDENSPVPTKIIVAQEQIKRFGNNYMVDPNNIIASTNILIEQRQNVLGLVTNVEDENRVYFANVILGNAISFSFNVNAERMRQYFVSSLINSLELNDVLKKAEAIVVHEKPEKDFVDLSPEALDKTTFIELLREN